MTATATSRGRVGILGGMFNPPHLGHLTLARTAIDDLGLSRVLLMPVLIPPHKPPGQDAGAEHRLRMCRLAVAEQPHVDVCTLELERPGPSYTVDTLRAIHARDPDAELTLIVGADVALTLGAWREPRAVLALAQLAVAERDGVSRTEVLEGLSPLRSDPASKASRPAHAGLDGTAFLPMPPCDVSSSMVRERVTHGLAVDGLVGAPVAGYIAQNELYLARTPMAAAAQQPLTGTA